MDEEKTQNLLEERKSLEGKLDSINAEIYDVLKNIVLARINDFGEFMPEKNIIEEVKKLDERYTERDVYKALDCLKDKDLVLTREVGGNGYENTPFTVIYAPRSGVRYKT